MRIGAHLTIAKGLPEAAELAASIGANTFAFFTRNPRGGAARAIGQEEIARWEAARAEKDIWRLVGHLPYTINLGAEPGKVRDFAIMALSEDLAKADAFGAEYLNVHPGSHGGAGAEAGVRRVVETLTAVFERYQPQRTMLLLETMAGQGNEVGGTIAELKGIIEGLGAPAFLGVCLDSCHLLAAGHDLRTPAGVEKMLDDFDRVIGLDRVKAMHLNDSKFPLGSRRDRHEMLGKGHLGEDGVKAVIRNEFIRGLPIIVETPVDDYMEYAGEIRLVKEWAG